MGERNKTLQFLIMSMCLGFIISALFGLSCDVKAAGGVVNGQPVNATVTNAAFLFKNADDTTVNLLNLNNGVAASGGSITNIQRQFNSICSFTGCLTNQVYNYLPTWTNNDVGSSSDPVKTRADALTAKFNLTSGHKHTGAAGDAPQITLTTGVTGTLPIANGGTGQATASAAFNALSPMTTSGDIIYGGSSGSGTRLGANSTSTNKYLQSVSSGTPTWQQIAFTDLSGTLAVNQGGTGQSSALTQYGVIYASTTSAMASTAAGTSGYLLTSNNSSAPTYQQLNLASSAALTGVLPYNNGGTGQSSWTTGDMLYASGTNTLAKRAIGSAGQILTVSSGVPTWMNNAGATLVPPLVTVYSSSSGTHTYTGSPLYARITIVGGGGGGGGSGTGSGNGGDGGDTTFGSFTGGKGHGGVSGIAGSQGGAGGSASGGTINRAGAVGQGGTGTLTGLFAAGGTGGASCVSGGGGGGVGGGAGSNANDAGGGGGGAGSGSNLASAGGGGGGGCLIVYKTSSFTNTSYSIGAAGSAGSAGSGIAGGAGAAGQVIVEEYYQ